MMKPLLIGVFDLLCAGLMVYTISLNYDQKNHLRKVLEVCILVICFLIGVHHIAKFLIIDVERFVLNPVFDNLGWFIDVLNGVLTIIALMDNINTKNKINS